MTDPFATPDALLAFLDATPEKSFHCLDVLNCGLAAFVSKFIGEPACVGASHWHSDSHRKFNPVPQWAKQVWDISGGAMHSTYAEAAARVREALHA